MNKTTRKFSIFSLLFMVSVAFAVILLFTLFTQRAEPNTTISTSDKSIHINDIEDEWCIEHGFNHATSGECIRTFEDCKENAAGMTRCTYVCLKCPIPLTNDTPINCSSLDCESYYPYRHY